MLRAAAMGDPAGAALTVSDEAAVTVVLAAGTYPEQGNSGGRIEGIDAAKAESALVFHAGTALRHGELVTNGGRILNVTALGETLGDARALAYRAAGLVSFPGVRYRRDIAEEGAHVAG
jgi:phosphoribosylamine--glycine ligase